VERPPPSPTFPRITGAVPLPEHGELSLSLAHLALIREVGKCDSGSLLDSPLLAFSPLLSELVAYFEEE